MARSLAKDYDLKRQSILKTAARYFAAHGYDRSSMNELAQACGVSKALIYHYHASKEALLYDILHDHFDQIISTISSINESGPAEERLRARVDALLMSYRGADDEHRLQLSAMEALPIDQQDVLRKMQRKIVKIFTDDIIQVSPKLASEHKEMITPVTMSLFGMLNWFYMWHQNPTPNNPQAITREKYASLATDILLGGLERLN